MNRIDLAAIWLMVMIAVMVMFQRIGEDTEPYVLTSKSGEIYISVERPHTDVVETAHRILYHCKMVAVESLLIAKISVNTVLDAAIDSLN